MKRPGFNGRGVLSLGLALVGFWYHLRSRILDGEWEPTPVFPDERKPPSCAPDGLSRQVPINARCAQRNSGDVRTV